jgi:hypothetical protein
MGQKGNAHKFPAGKPEWNKPKNDGRVGSLKQTGWVSVDWINLAQDRDEWCAIVNTITNIRIPQNAVKFLS